MKSAFYILPITAATALYMGKGRTLQGWEGDSSDSQGNIVDDEQENMDQGGFKREEPREWDDDVQGVQEGMSRRYSSEVQDS